MEKKKAEPMPKVNKFNFDSTDYHFINPHYYHCFVIRSLNPSAHQLPPAIKAQENNRNNMLSKTQCHLPQSDNICRDTLTTATSLGAHSWLSNMLSALQIIFWWKLSTLKYYLYIWSVSGIHRPHYDDTKQLSCESMQGLVTITQSVKRKKKRMACMW